MNNRNSKDIVLGGLFGIVLGVIIAGSLPILSVAGHLGGGAGPPHHCLHAARLRTNRPGWAEPAHPGPVTARPHVAARRAEHRRRAPRRSVVAESATGEIHGLAERRPCAGDRYQVMGVGAERDGADQVCPSSAAASPPPTAAQKVAVGQEMELAETPGAEIILGRIMRFGTAARLARCASLFRGRERGRPGRVPAESGSHPG